MNHEKMTPPTPWRRMPNFTTRLPFLAAVGLIVAISIFSPAPSALASPSSDVQVIVYAGPKECSNDNIDAKTNGGKLNKIIPNSIVGLHFTATIDPTSTASRSLLGKVIESSKSGMGIAPSFPIGQGKVISGLDLGLIGLCRGSSAYIIVPPHWGYGSLGKPNVGVEPDTTLRYDVEILDIQPPIPNDFVKIDGNHDWLISVDEAEAYFDSLGQAIDLEGLWKEEDKDHDGFISWEEFTGPKGGEGPPSDAAKKQGRQKARAATDTMTKPKKQEKKKVNNQQTQTAKRRDDMSTLLRSIDTDNDGKISKIELANTFRSLGQEMTEEFWRESDPDGDGYVSFEEFVGDSSTTATSTSSDEMVESGEEL